MRSLMKRVTIKSLFFVFLNFYCYICIMTHQEELTSKGKYLSFILRHSMEDFNAGLIDESGYMSISELIKKGFTEELIDEIVNTNNKARYEYNEDHTRLRARQGHSIPVDVGLTPTTPPEILYHGTATRFVESILKSGLKPMSRLYVHLFSDIQTATTVGERHGKPVVFIINSKEMVIDGYQFFLSNNGVWLTKEVPVKYLHPIAEPI